MTNNQSTAKKLRSYKLNVPEIFSKLQTMQTTVFEIQREHQEQLNLKNDKQHIRPGNYQ